jgi:alkylhydroperoxidase family enzyme
VAPAACRRHRPRRHGPAGAHRRRRPGHARAAYTHSTIEDDAAASYVDKVVRHAYRVTDADVEALLRSGWSEAQVLELTIAAALGAGQRRLDAGLAALGGER